MPDISLSDAAFDELDEKGVSAYREAVHAGRYAPDHIAQAIGIPLREAETIGQRLVHLCLLRPMPGAPDVLVPVSPDAAAANLVGPAEEQIRELQQSVSRTRDGLLALLPAYFESRRRRNPMESFDIISDYLVVEALLKDCGDRCRTEVLTVQPGGPAPPTCWKAPARSPPNASPAASGSSTSTSTPCAGTSPTRPTSATSPRSAPTCAPRTNWSTG